MDNVVTLASFLTDTAPLVVTTGILGAIVLLVLYIVLKVVIPALREMTQMSEVQRQTWKSMFDEQKRFHALLVEGLERDLADERTERVKLEARLGVLEAELRQKDERIATLEAEIKALQQTLAARDVIIKNLEARVSDLERLILEKDARIKQLEIELAQIKQTLAETAKERDELAKQKQKLEAEVEQLRSEVAALRRELEEAKKADAAEGKKADVRTEEATHDPPLG